MTQKPILEIAVESLATARAAERAGADRIELCADLRLGGLTPSAELMRQARKALTIPVHVMIRPRAQDFLYTGREIAAMREAIVLAHELKMQGVVFGVLKSDRNINLQQTKELVELAAPLAVTFHRAFDECPNLSDAMEEVILAGATEILTSGGETDAIAGKYKLQELVRTARQRIMVMPGAGITPANIKEVRETTKAREFHSGLGTVLPYGHGDISRFEALVRELVKELNS